MTNTFNVEFLGLTGIVPEGSKDDNDSYDSFLIVMPDLDLGYTDSELPKPILPHLNAFIAPVDCIDHQEPMQRHFVIRNENGSVAHEYAIFPLHNERLVIDGLSNSPLDNTVRDIDPNDPDTWVPVNGDEQHLTWVPRIELAERQNRPNAGFFDAHRFLSADLTPILQQPSQLSSVLRIDRGKFYISDVVRNNSGVRLFDFSKIENGSPLPPEWSQAVHSKLLWSSQFDSQSIQLKIKREGEKEKPLVTLRSQSNQINAWIANLEFNDIENSLPPLNNRNRHSIDYDFAIFYFYSKWPPSDGLPVPRTNESLASELTCNPPLFKG